MFIGWCLPAGAADWLTPEAATRSFYESIQRIEDAPDTPEFKAEIEEIFTDDAVVLLVVGDQSSGFLTVGALETAAKLALKKKYRRQINDSGKEIASINCTTHGAMAACYITVEVTLREGSGGSRTFEDIVNLRRQDGRWYVTRAKETCQVYTFIHSRSAACFLGKRGGCDDGVDIVKLLGKRVVVLSSRRSSPTPKAGAVVTNSQDRGHLGNPQAVPLDTEGHQDFPSSYNLAAFASS